MNDQEKENISYMRKKGESYASIAEALNISINTVKSYCRRNNLSGVLVTEPPDNAFCDQCGKKLTHTEGAKQRRFCSDKCRMSWWNAHPEAVRRKALYSFTCAQCGGTFESYGNKNRKYCSRACYGKSKAVCNE